VEEPPGGKRTSENSRAKNHEDVDTIMYVIYNKLNLEIKLNVYSVQLTEW
jgi:hypothetical protein